MAVNRYELPSQQQVANTYVDMPYKELLLAGQAQQAEYDKIEASRNEWANKQWNNLSPDDELAKAKQAWLESETSKIADLWSKDPRQARQAFKTFERDAVKEFGKFGSIGAMEANYNARAAYEKQIDERIEKGINKVPQKASMMAKFDEEYAKNKGIGGNETGKWNKYNTEDAVGWINPTEWANEKGKGFEASLKSFANYTMSDDGYIYTDKFTGERLTPEELKSGLDYYYAGDPEMQAMIDQGTKYGYASMDMLVNAIEGAKVKYGYERITSEKDIKGDPNYQSKLDQKEKTATIINRPETPEPMNNPDLSKKVWGILGKDSELAQNYAKQQEQFKTRINATDEQIREAYKIANDPLATEESKRDAAANYQSLNMQKSMMYAEQDTKNQVHNAVVNNVFKANGVKSSDMQTFNTMNTLVNNVDKNNSEIKKLTTELNSIGNAAFNVLDKNGKTIPADDYRNTLRQQIKNLENSNIKSYKELYTITTGEEANVNSIQDLTKLKVNPYNVAKKSLKESSEAIATYETDRVSQSTSTFIGGVPNNKKYQEINSFLQTNPDLFKVEILDDATGKYKQPSKYNDPFGLNKTDEIKTVTRQNSETNSYTMTVTDSKGNFIREERYTPKTDVPDLDKALINFYKEIDPTGVNPSSTNAIMKLESKEILNSTNNSIKYLAGVKPSEYRNVYAPPTPMPKGYYTRINIDGVVNGKTHYNLDVYNVKNEKVEVGLDDNTPLEGLTDEQLKNANMLIYQQIINPNNQ